MEQNPELLVSLWLLLLQFFCFVASSLHLSVGSLHLFANLSVDYNNWFHGLCQLQAISLQKGWGVGWPDDGLGGSQLRLREIIQHIRWNCDIRCMNALSPPSPPNATHKANSNQCSADWQTGQLWFKTERQLRQPRFSRVGGGAGGRRDDLVLTVVLHLEFDRTVSIHWRLEGRWWPWWHHSAVHCGLLGSDCVFKDDDYWAKKSQWWERRTKGEENDAGVIR